MKIFLVELVQKTPKWSRPIRHVQADSAKEACERFVYLCNSSSVSLRAHELKRYESGELVGKEGCAGCFEYLHTKTRYFCHTPGCSATGILLSQYDLNESQGQVNCEYCDKPLQAKAPAGTEKDDDY